MAPNTPPPASVADLLAAHQLDERDRERLFMALFAAMRTSFLARWHELGLSGTAPDQRAMARLRREADETATSMARTHNQALTRRVAEFVDEYTAEHPDPAQRVGLRSALAQAMQAWVEARVAWKPSDIAQMATLRALSLADLYAGDSSDVYTVDGPEPTDASCATCRSLFGRVLTADQAYAVLMPNHANCEHYIRVLSPSEAAHAASPPSNIATPLR